MDLLCFNDDSAVETKVRCTHAVGPEVDFILLVWVVSILAGVPNGTGINCAVVRMEGGWYA